MIPALKDYSLNFEKGLDPLLEYVIGFGRDYIKFDIPRTVWKTIQFDIDKIKGHGFKEFTIECDPIEITCLRSSGLREFLPGENIILTIRI